MDPIWEAGMGGLGRRQFLIVAGVLLAASTTAKAQAPAGLRRIGMLMPVRATDAVGNIEAFRQGLARLGYLEGQNIALEPRYSDGDDERFGQLAAELVRRKVDVIVTWGTPSARAAKRATRNIPIVMAAAIDPVGTGLITSLGQPGGNVTGLTSGGAELSRKTVELLKDAFPDAVRIGVLWNPSNPIQPVMFRETQIAADLMKLRVLSFGVADVADLEAVFKTIQQQRPDALIVLQDLMLQAHRARILDFVAKNRLPAVYERNAWVESGGLMSYGVSFAENFRRAATYVDRVFKGAKPAQLPVEDPTQFELVVNLRSARALGVTIPPVVLLRADKVIR